jgi:branched-chain amino acid transport system permease protein
MDIIPQLIINSIIAGSIYSLVALGFNLIYGTTKFFNLAHGVVATIGGYTVFCLSTTLGLGIIPSAIVGILMAGLVGYLIDKSVFRALRLRKASGMVFLVASLGVMTAIQAIIAIIFSSEFQTLSVRSDFKVYQVFGGIITQLQLVIFIASILIMLALALILKFTRFGKSVIAISDDEEVSKTIGINTDKIVGRIFFIGSAIAGLSGILVGLDTGIEPTMGLSLLFKGVIASIIGGIGNAYGGVLGAFLLAFIENFGIWKISGEWKDAISFGVLIIFLLFRPNGILRK